ncbi:hypothetical protein [Streptomyces olivoreticuli]|uniref:hypothetical protein n=1 Tax=Streptomyces olivoreticuli TaxID=68246 RepID=UPI000E228D75|nr:hypothetical protein [Streptomyces olivoreticuli]
MVSTDHSGIGIGSFACIWGEQQRTPYDIPDFERLWRERSSDADFSSMGCETFRTMTAPVEEYVIEAVRRTLADGSVSPEDVDHILFTTSDGRLASLGGDFTTRVLDALGLVDCVPMMLSFQQCCSSLTALRQGYELLLRDPDVRNVVLVSLDFTPDDSDRVRSFALFGDAVASCLIARGGQGLVRLLASAVRVDHEGLLGRESFVSRQKAAQSALAKVAADSGRRLADVTKVFPTNLYTPITLFNSTIAGLQRDRLHFARTLAAYGHCGNSDWMINLVDHHGDTGIRPGETHLAVSSAPGFFACGLLEGI